MYTTCICTKGSISLYIRSFVLPVVSTQRPSESHWLSGLTLLGHGVAIVDAVL